MKLHFLIPLLTLTLAAASYAACTGTCTGCDTLTNETSCETYGGCAWQNNGNCSWFGDYCQSLDETECGLEENCTWDTDTCYSLDYGCYDNYTNQTTCETDPYCVWIDDDIDYCDSKGFFDCPVADIFSCTQPTCLWTDTSTCEDIVSNCSGYGEGVCYLYTCPTTSCSWCMPNWVNTTWSVWSNLTSCYSNDTYQQRRSLTQYDNNSCSGSTNTTFYDYRWLACDYCSITQTTITTIGATYPMGKRQIVRTSTEGEIVVFTKSSPSDINMYYSTNNGETWSWGKIYNSTDSVSTFSIAIDSLDQIHVAFTTTAHNLKYLKVDADSLPSFSVSSSTTLSTDAYYPTILINSTNNPIIIFDNFLQNAVYHTYHTTSWSTPFLIHQNIGTPNSHFSDATLSSDNNIHICFGTINNDTGRYYAYGRYNGTTWSLTDLTDLTSPNFYECSIIAKTTNPYILWNDQNNYNIYLMYNLGSWSIPLLIANDSMDYATAFGVDNNNMFNAIAKDGTNALHLYSSDATNWYSTTTTFPAGGYSMRYSQFNHHLNCIDTSMRSGTTMYYVRFSNLEVPCTENWQQICTGTYQCVDLAGCGTELSKPSNCGQVCSGSSGTQYQTSPPKFDISKIRIIQMTGLAKLIPPQIFAFDLHWYGRTHQYTIKSTVPIYMCHFDLYDCDIYGNNTIILTYPKKNQTMSNIPWISPSELGYICPNAEECFHYPATYQILNLNWRYDTPTNANIFPFISPNGYNIIPFALAFLLIYYALTRK